MDMESTRLNGFRRRLGMIAGIGGAVVLAAAAAIASTGTAHASTQLCSNQTGTESGYYYQMWENGTGSACITYNGGSYTTSFSSIGDYTAGVGWNPGNTNTVNFTSSVTDSAGTALVSVYGWMTSPLVEYYVEENWSGSTNGTGTNLGTFTDGGSTYTLWEHQQVNQPCITGNSCTFEQYVAVRTSPTTSSSVNMANVEAAWKAKGLSIGTMNYEMVGSEAYNGGTGSTSVTIGGSGSSPTPTPTPTPSPTTSSSGGSGTCSVTYTTTNSWAGGYSANVVIKNTGTSALSTWTAGFTYPGDQKMTNDYNGSFTQSGEAVKLTPASYNGSLAAGASTTVGVQGTWTSNDTAPASFTCT